MLRKASRKSSRIWAGIRHRSADPVAPSFYSARKPQSQAVSAGFKALKISDRQRFTLKAFGKPFNYQGVMTKRYDFAVLCRLFVISRVRLYSWIELGYLPEPQITLGRKRLWMYHQVQPFYVWYWHMKNAKVRLSGITEREYAVLTRMQRRADMRWHQMLGIEYPDPYRQKAGKYGVIHSDTP